MGKIKKAITVSHVWKYLVPVCIVLISCRFFQMNVRSLEQMRGGEIGLSVADYAVDFFKGELPYARSAQQTFNIPALWALYFISFSVLSGKGTAGSFSSMSQRTLLRKRTGGICGCA